MRVSNRENQIPVWERTTITLSEAADYTGIGVNKLRELSSAENCPFVLWIGNRRLIKRKKLEEYLDKQFSL